jgi:hypothetical protein
MNLRDSELRDPPGGADATMQDPCGRLPAPDSYAGSAAPSITGFSGHPTDCHALRADSYACQGILFRIGGSDFGSGLLKADKTGKGRSRYVGVESDAVDDGGDGVAFRLG